MLCWILPESGIPVSVFTVQRQANDARGADGMKTRIDQYEGKLKALFEATSANISTDLLNVDTGKVSDPYDENPEFFQEFNRGIDDENLPHVDDLNDVEVVTDQYIGMELALPRGNEATLAHAKVQKRLRDEKGRPVSMAQNNPLLDTRKYEVEFSDGHIEELTANIIAENLIAQVNQEG